MPINLISSFYQFTNEFCPYTTSRGYRRDQMAILGGLKSKFGGLIYEDQNQGCATWLSLAW